MRSCAVPLPATVALASAVILLATVSPAGAQESMPAQDVLARSIAHHDPDDRWANGAFRIVITGTRPLAGPTFTTVLIDNAAGSFELQRERWGRKIESTVTGAECTTRLDGSAEPTAEEIERFDLSCEAMRRQRDYHTFLYGLPMKLRDPGTRIAPEATRTTYDDRDVWQLRVTYDPEVGTDTWYFYFDPESYALVGYRFHHDEAAGDGEYILLDREEEGGGIRIPKVRSWFTHGDDRLLGTDTVRSVERIGDEL